MESKDLNVEQLEKHAKEIGVPLQFFNKVLGMSSSTISYWKHKKGGKIPEEHHALLIQAIINLKYTLDGQELQPKNGAVPDDNLKLVTALLESASIMLARRKGDDSMLTSAHESLRLAVDIIKKNRYEL